MRRGSSGWLLVLSGCALPVFAGADDAGAEPLRELSRMSLEQLANVEVTSVSKAAQSLSTAPASIYVITHEEIRRSGALSIPEALRLALRQVQPGHLGELRLNQMNPIAEILKR